MNLALKIKILNSGKSQFEISRIAKIKENFLSRIINDRENPDRKTRAAIAKALRCSQKEIFPES